MEHILKDHLASGAGGLGRSTLETLATIAEELSRLNLTSETTLKTAPAVNGDINPQPATGRKVLAEAPEHS